MKKIGDRYTNNIFENIKHIDDYENEYMLQFYSGYTIDFMPRKGIDVER